MIPLPTHPPSHPERPKEVSAPPPTSVMVGPNNGYALIEYENFVEAQNATSKMNGARILGRTISVDWAFIKAPTEYSFGHMVTASAKFKTGVRAFRGWSECIGHAAMGTPMLMLSMNEFHP
ncbi:hypothetical protein RJ640_001068 [Escallonia rubra]|uniref:RRM domain-containing protein n=1 Tax=Escallonia rubra TaxID=112253 RepID=A0AA88QKD4_9ASTE|nr:hypothetical protein RJ640_001068 [Escallonia rubra]